MSRAAGEPAREVALAGGVCAVLTIAAIVVPSLVVRAPESPRVERIDAGPLERLRLARALPPRRPQMTREPRRRRVEEAAGIVERPDRSAPPAALSPSGDANRAVARVSEPPAVPAPRSAAPEPVDDGPAPAGAPPVAQDPPAPEPPDDDDAPRSVPPAAPVLPLTAAASGDDDDEADEDDDRPLAAGAAPVDAAEDDDDEE